MGAHFMYPGTDRPDTVPRDPTIPVDEPRFADFGNIILETDIDAEILQTLYIWMPTYLAQICREREMAVGSLPVPAPASYINALEDETFSANFVPAIIVTTAQTDGEPEQIPDGYNAQWRVVIQAAVRGRTPSETRMLASMYGGCVRRILFHQGIPLAGWLRWIGGNVAPQPGSTDEEGRYLAIGYNQFTLYTDDALTGEGPVTPSPYPDVDPGDPDKPYEPLVTVTKVTTTINAR